MRRACPIPDSHSHSHSSTSQGDDVGNVCACTLAKSAELIAHGRRRAKEPQKARKRGNTRARAEACHSKSIAPIGLRRWSEVAARGFENCVTRLFQRSFLSRFAGVSNLNSSGEPTSHPSLPTSDALTTALATSSPPIPLPCVPSPPPTKTLFHTQHFALDTPLSALSTRHFCSQHLARHSADGKARPDTSHAKRNRTIIHESAPYRLSLRLTVQGLGL